MRLLEVLDFPVADGEFELLNLTGPVDEDIFIDMLDGRDLMLTYNGVQLKNLDRLMDPFVQDIHKHFHGDAPSHDGHESLQETSAAYYDYDTMCIYLEETFKVYGGRSSKATTGIRMVHERICYTNKHKVNTLKFLEAAEWGAVMANKADLVNLRKVVPGIP